jgi:hypothetical protein
VGGPKLVRVGCWAHARRKFVDAVKVHPQDGEAVKMVARMDALFLIDREARKHATTNAERLVFAASMHSQGWTRSVRLVSWYPGRHLPQRPRPTR